jgi:glycosyltransferase involved in cell wall biosynthesis
VVSVIIPSRNRLPWLQRTVAALLQQRQPPPWEAVVVDDGSRDGTAAWVRGLPDPIRLLARAAPGGRAAARNAGAAAARGDVLLFLDADVIALPTLLRTHAELAAPGRVVSGSPWCWREAGAAATDPIPAGEVVQAGGPAPWLHFVTRVVSLPRDDFWRVGGFDTGFRGYGFEDWELGYRLHRAGSAFVLASDGSGYHQPHDVSDRGPADLRRNYGWFLQRHPDLDVALMVLAPPWRTPEAYVRLLAAAQRLQRWPEVARSFERAVLAAARRWSERGEPVRVGDPIRAVPPELLLEPGAREALWWLQRLG